MTSPLNKRLGFCPVTGEQIFEIEKEFPSGHPMAGRAAKLGKPSPSAVKATLVLTSGKITEISMHADALGLIKKNPELLVNLHAVNCQALVDEEAYREFLYGGRPTSYQKDAISKSMVGYAKSPPLGVLHVKRWKERSNG